MFSRTESSRAKVENTAVYRKERRLICLLMPELFEKGERLASEGLASVNSPTGLQYGNVEVPFVKPCGGVAQCGRICFYNASAGSVEAIEPRAFTASSSASCSYSSHIKIALAYTVSLWRQSMPQPAISEGTTSRKECPSTSRVLDLA